MKLYSHPASPFARKVRVVAHELDAKLEVINVNPAGNAELRRVNPLGKIPALVLDDGSALFDSPVICEYLNERHGGKFFPGMSIWRSSTGRWRALGLQALGDGIADAAVARMAESRCRKRSATPPRWRNISRRSPSASTRSSAPRPGRRGADHRRGRDRVRHRLSRFPHPELVWRTTRPNLRDWFDKFCKYGSMLATAPANLA